MSLFLPLVNVIITTTIIKVFDYLNDECREIEY